MYISKKKLSLSGLCLALLFCAVMFMADSCNSQTQSSFNDQNAAAQKWGSNPNITNFYEYQQLKEIYEMRDNPKLILNAYLFSEQTGQLTCFGRVKGFGIPYGTEFSPPNNGTEAVPEPNALYPSNSTSADWIQYINPDGTTTLGFVEPNMIITAATLPCKPLSS